MTKQLHSVETPRTKHTAISMCVNVYQIYFRKPDSLCMTSNLKSHEQTRKGMLWKERAAHRPRPDSTPPSPLRPKHTSTPIHSVATDEHTGFELVCPMCPSTWQRPRYVLGLALLKLWTRTPFPKSGAACPCLRVAVVLENRGSPRASCRPREHRLCSYRVT